MIPYFDTNYSSCSTLFLFPLYLDSSDYVPIENEIITFSESSGVSSGDQMCVVANVIGDDIQEEDEFFTVVMVPQNINDVIMGPSRITITIPADDDGIYTFLLLFFSMCYRAVGSNAAGHVLTTFWLLSSSKSQALCRWIVHRHKLFD